MEPGAVILPPHSGRAVLPAVYVKVCTDGNAIFMPAQEPKTAPGSLLLQCRNYRIDQQLDPNSRLACGTTLSLLWRLRYCAWGAAAWIVAKSWPATAYISRTIPLQSRFAFIKGADDSHNHRPAVLDHQGRREAL
jgi:hypothetical protein